MSRAGIRNKLRTMPESVQDAWNPGIKSTLPAEFLPLSTLFRPENVFTSIETATELSDFTGLGIQQLVIFRPERLVVHELLIRVSADLFVSDGSRYEDLGVNFRKLAGVILSDYINPNMTEINHAYHALEQRARSLIEAELTNSLFPDPVSLTKPQASTGLLKFFKSRAKKTDTTPIETAEQRDQRVVSSWRQQAEQADEDLPQAVFHSLVKLAGAIVAKHGRLIGDKDLLAMVATGLVCNEYGSKLIGELISPFIQQAAAMEKLILLPVQKEPVVINIKGASASGKSTMRPAQKKQVEKLGLNWQDFALISPDIWRKFLLDYSSLGSAYKYAGTLAGDEIPIIDRKLDSYISEKAKQGRLSHFLIDRFRFDSFAPGHDSEEGSNLLTRFGHSIYLIFMVTPPEATVERAWKRGLQVGRFKAVDDLLDHNIEAFKGIPVLFFTWALRKDKIVHYEFLDNSVAIGEKPRTIAFGLNGEMYILDFKCMLDIVRYTRININATEPSEVYPADGKMDPASNTEFLKNCARKIPRLNFVDPACGQVYACMESGRMSWIAPDLMAQILTREEPAAGFEAIAPGLVEDLMSVPHESPRPIPEEARRHTLGALS